MNILFDLDGTIIDPGDGIIKSYSKALVALGFEDKITPDMNWVVGPPLRKSFATILPSEMVEDAVAKYREFHAAGGLIEAILYDDIAAIIENLHASGHQLFICTAKNVPFARQNIEQFDLLGYFTEIYGSHLDGKFDDKAELVGHIIDTHQLDKSQTFMIGDREHDIIAAKKNGIAGIGVLWGYGSEDELKRAEASDLVDNPQELLRLINQLQKINA
jgi:phosphoglycolate phosphatase